MARQPKKAAPPQLATKKPPKRASDNGPPEIVSGAVLSALLADPPFTDRWLRELADRGFIVRAGRGLYDLKKSVQGYVRFIRETEVAAATTPERGGLDAERTRKLRLENDEREGRLVDTGLALNAVDAIAGMIRTDLAGLPARISEDVTIRRRAEDAIDTVLAGLADRFTKAGAALEQGRDPLAADDEDDA